MRTRESSTGIFVSPDVKRELRRHLATVVEALLPRLCLGCDRRLGARGAPLLLCRRCQGQLRPWRPGGHCETCLRPIPQGEGGRARCLECVVRPPAYERLVAAWIYAPPLDRVIRSLKFSRLDRLAPSIARQADGWIPWHELEPFELVAPVPLLRLRRAVRGFNQAELLARELAHTVGKPFRNLLIRKGLWSNPQARRGARERRRATPPGFSAPHPGEIAGRSVLLIDDVVTTGVTLRTAADALRRAGAARIVALAIAATPSRTPWQLA